jgi:hypothetical protein
VAHIKTGYQGLSKKTWSISTKTWLESIKMIILSFSLPKKLLKMTEKRDIAGKT